MKQLPKHLSQWLFAAFVCASISACGGDDSSSNSDPADESPVAPAGDDENESPDAERAEFTTKKVNAASYSDWVYVDLANDRVLDIDEETAATSSEWHIALRRTAIKLNGGDSGNGNVAAALADAQDDFYDENGDPDANIFMNADADIEATALSAAYDASTLNFVQDSNEPAMADWYSYDFVTHQISADSSVGFLIRHQDGETYSKLFLDAVSYTDITVRYTTQASGTSQFAGSEQTFSASFDDDATLLCLDFDSAQAVSCEDSGWELRYEVDLSRRAINMWTNGGVFGDGNGAVFGAIEATELAAYTSATNINGSNISSHYKQDSSTGIFSEQTWYAYNLSGQHKLWPNYRTYLIDSDVTDEAATQFTLQISNYYSLGASGSPELRFRAIASDNE